MDVAGSDFESFEVLSDFGGRVGRFRLGLPPEGHQLVVFWSQGQNAIQNVLQQVDGEIS